MINTSGLSLEQAPPLSVPFRFFATAPLFGILASILLALSSPELLTSRWSPFVLAGTHLFFLGFLVSIMMGALFQILPVLAGSVIARPRLVSSTLLTLHVAGTLGLAYGLATADWKHAALPVGALLAGIGLFLFSALLALRSSRSRHPTVPGLKLAAVGLLLTAILGGTAAAALAGRSVIPFFRPALTDLHLSQALVSWVFLLIASVAYQVIPMFYVTSAYPPKFTRWFAPITFGLVLLQLCATVAASLWSLPELLWFRPLILVPPILFSAYTLKLIAQRRRKVPDPSLRFWRVGLGMGIAGCIAWLLPLSGPFEVVLGILWAGAVAAIVAGMLFKIIAFLVWFHVQAQWMALMNTAPLKPSLATFRVPNMKQIVPDRLPNAALGALLIGLALSACVPFFPTRLLTLPAAAVWIVFFGTIEAAVLEGVRVHRKSIGALLASE